MVDNKCYKLRNHVRLQDVMNVSLMAWILLLDVQISQIIFFVAILNMNAS